MSEDKKKVRLRKKDAKRIADFAAALARELGISGSIGVSNRKRKVMCERVVGQPRPMTRIIAINKARQPAYTGSRTSITAEAVLSGARTLGLYGIDSEEFVPFGGGCPIYTKEGAHVGGAGFSEETAVTDERIIAAAIEACGFLSEGPKQEDISEKKIRKAAKRVKEKLSKKE